MEYCDGCDFEAFMANRMLQEACVFNILQIGELAKNGLDESFTNAHADIPWRQMYGLRNRIAHDYEGIQMRIVWETISNDFPALRRALEAILDTAV
ncbi:MAG: DUF86 domain-containing protein [Clostridia bacterium]|nr:DUF86 domain-containing protein [Clostridia bacterium]